MLEWADRFETRRAAKNIVKNAVVAKYPNAIKGGDGCIMPTRYEVAKLFMKVLTLIRAKSMDKRYRKEAMDDLFWVYGI